MPKTSKTQKGSRFAPAAGLMLTVACSGGLPAGTEPLTEEQRQEVLDDLEAIDMHMEFAIDALNVADPLFDLSGAMLEENTELGQGVYQLREDLQNFYELDRFVVARSYSYLQGNNASAHGAHSVLSEDNYIVLAPDSSRPSGMKSYALGTYMHEASHFYYDTDGQHNTINDRIERGVYGDLGEYILENNDVGYLMSRLFAIGAYSGSKHLSDTGAVTTVWAMRDDPEGMEEELDRVFREVHAYSLLSTDEYMDEFMDDWFGEAADDRSINIWDKYAFMGVTRDELRDVALAHPEIQESKRRTGESLLETMRGLYPERTAELDRELSPPDESRSELRAGRR